MAHPRSCFVVQKRIYGNAALSRGRSDQFLERQLAPQIGSDERCSQHIWKTFMLRSGDVETVKVHDFVPRRDKVLEELLLRVLTPVDFRQGPQLGV
jgi:hypothetical protein